MKRLALALAAFALPSAVSAQTLRCIQQDQAAALVTFALPSLVQGLAQRCGPELRSNSYLMANAGALADRYRPDAAAAWPAARTAIAGIFTQFLGQEMPPEMNSDLVRQLAEPLLGNLLAKRISTTDCVAADSAISAAAVLPGRNVGRLAIVAIMLADRKDKGIAGVLHICRPEIRP
ncbi:hypothetical protein HL653_18065 [Sphingomonas sp. AP4-R1]|uniref:hypothetical protein n=1 Tax=Sphingomonas sp. AP4-R1 TaxID=2735134 RepID=UPI001493D863|nr:hypothetical protein [Sphingomonas sp. AP4-R1]QJU59408.1 hypothetical protein HL653_18065 [Sphingomonas sp. AP4-R1]